MRKENWAFCSPLTKIVTSQLGFAFIIWINIWISCKIQTFLVRIKWNLAQLWFIMRRRRNINFRCHSNMLGSKPLFYHFWIKSKEIPLWPYWEVENEIIVFLINEGSQPRMLPWQQNIWYLEFLSSCLISIPSFTWFWPLTPERHSI